MCAKTRDIVRQVDWNCEVSTDYADGNMGCQKRVSSGLDWAFSLVEEAIILEDDCLPDPTFFRFCQELLERYRCDDRVGHISGDNFKPRPAGYPHSYYFSRYAFIWGWATWRRAWQHYDVNMGLWPEIKASGCHYGLFSTREEAYYFEDMWDEIHSGQLGAWGPQWLFTCLVQGSLSVVPEVNLVSNIGFGPESTHTVDSTCSLASQPTGNITFPLRHPPFFVRNQEEETEVAEFAFFRGKRRIRSLWRRLRNRHFYGSLVRRFPFLGGWWAKLRQSRNRGGR